jgi:hypothetical protein
MDTFFAPTSITAGIVALLVLWLVKALWGRICLHRDTLALEEWLWTHTEDEPDESHRSIAELARCLHLSEERVNRAVDHSRTIFRSATHGDLVSVWRTEAQRVSEERDRSAI